MYERGQHCVQIDRLLDVVDGGHVEFDELFDQGTVLFGHLLAGFKVIVQLLWLDLFFALFAIKRLYFFVLHI